MNDHAEGCLLCNPSDDLPAAVAGVCAAVALAAPLVASRIDPAITPFCRWAARRPAVLAVLAAFGVHLILTVIDERRNLS